MERMELTKSPVVHTAMLIRRPVSQVFEAIIDSAITSHFWFSKGSGRLVAGRTVQWEWEMYGVSIDVTATEIEPHKLIVMEWLGCSGPTTVTWRFQEVPDGTFVEVEEAGWNRNGRRVVEVCKG